MSSVSKFTADRNQRILLDLVSKPGNDVCADCKARTPRWASHNLGIFICMNCASIHRKIGTHITKVKSVTMDSWSRDQVEVMKSIGNVASNKRYNPDEARHPPPANREESERDSELEKFIRWKYEFKRFMDKSGGNPPKPAPSSLSSSLMLKAQPPRPKSTPAASMARRSSPLPPLPTSLVSNPPATLTSSHSALSASSSSSASATFTGTPLWQPSALSKFPAPAPATTLTSIPASAPAPTPAPYTAAPQIPQPAPQPTPKHTIWEDMMSLASPGSNHDQQQSPSSTMLHQHPQPHLQLSTQFQPQQSYASSVSSGSTNTFGPSSTPTQAFSSTTGQFPGRSVSLPVLTGSGSSNPFPMQGLNTQTQQHPGVAGNPFAQGTHGYQVPGQMLMQSQSQTSMHMHTPLNGGSFQLFQPLSPVVQQVQLPFSHSYTPNPTPTSTFPQHTQQLQQQPYPQQQHQQLTSSAFPQQYGQQASHVSPGMQAFPQQQAIQGGDMFATPAWQQQQQPYSSWGGM